MRRDWQGDPSFRRALRGAVIGFLVALFGVLAVFFGQELPNALVENIGAVVALVGLGITALAVVAGFALGVRSLWRRTS